MGRFIVATDTGGTFVDAVLWDENGSPHIGKAPSTPSNPPDGILNAIEAAARLAGLDLAEVLNGAVMLNNGTTVTTNAMIERKGGCTGLLTTAGFEDTLAIARVLGRTIGLDESQLYDYRHADPPAPIVPVGRVRGVIERIDARGEVIVPLQETSVEEALSELVNAGIEVLAICFLWSFRNPDHERRAAEIAHRLYPDLFVVTSNELVPIIREYERANTTVINAYLGPVFERYAKGIRQHLRSVGFGHEPLIMQSVGGLAPAHEIERTPITTLFSGPVGGVIASQKLGAVIGEANLITTDMGGTSFDVGLILNGSPLTVPKTVIERQMVAIPTVEIVTVGAGGGSAVWLNEIGTLNVGPQSMGSQPGPVCYKRGGATPTVTDADVILGYIDADYFLGGNMSISREMALEAMDTQIAKPLGISVIEAAAGVYEIVNARMADLIRRATVQRGHDPREFAMVAFGGCGPTHCTAYGPDIGVRRVIVPAEATVFSAAGIGQSEFRHSLVHSFPQELRKSDGTVRLDFLAELNQVLHEMVSRSSALVREDGGNPAEAEIVVSADLRYRNQIHELTVPLPKQLPLGPQDLSRLVASFEEQYDFRYGSGASSPNSRIEWISLRVDSTALTPMLVTTKRRDPSSQELETAFLGKKQVYRMATRQLEPTPVYQAELLQPGHVLDGPALIVSYGMTIPLHDGQILTVDEYGQFIVTFSPLMTGEESRLNEFSVL